MYAKVYKATEGESYDVAPKNGKYFEYEELKEFVGGYIEIVYLKDDRIMVVNEEGLLIGLDVNFEATKIVEYKAMIVGDVLVCDSNLVK